MKTLIIYAHPNKKGHCGLILKEVINQVKNYDMIDLYKEKYDPVLKENELYTQGNQKVDKKNEKYQQMIKKAKKIIIIFPVWWAAPPAVLKGWFDRVFIDKVVFKKEGFKYTGLLKGTKAAVFLTSGAPTFVTKIINGERANRMVTKDTLKFCGIKAKAFPLGNANMINDKTQARVEKLVSKGLNFLGN